jgi:dihydroorotase
MSRGLAGRDDSHLDDLEAILAGADGSGIRVLSDDGKDLADEALLLAVFRRAAMLDLLASCHCELPGSASDREAEIRGVERAIALGREAGCRLHIAHVSTRESIELVRRAKAEAQAAAAPGTASFRLSCEATPHHLALNSAAAQLLGAHSHGRVNPGLRDEDDRLAVIEGLRDGSIDAIATDHAPHSAADKAGGAPGFSGLETAFALSSSTLGPLGFDLSRLSALMSAVPARILGLTDRGRLDPGMRADLVLVDPDEVWTVDPDRLRSRGKNTPIAGRHLRGRIRLTIHDGRIVYDEL